MASLTKQDEYDDEDDWNPCKAAGVCLMLLATCCEDDILPHVLPFGSLSCGVAQLYRNFGFDLSQKSGGSPHKKDHVEPEFLLIDQQIMANKENCKLETIV